MVSENATAPHKPGDIFITDVVREIIKIKSVFVKRKILDLLFYKILNPGFRSCHGISAPARHPTTNYGSPKLLKTLTTQSTSSQNAMAATTKDHLKT
ncbi:hypothetical protein B566_EDAN012130 [Ephemera danica]|nr:hypothetical protein B566_EDAN012130 [Ephemera danica]